MISSVDYIPNNLHEAWRAAKPPVWLEYLQRVILSFVDWAAEQTSDIVSFNAMAGFVTVHVQRLRSRRPERDFEARQR